MKLAFLGLCVSLLLAVGAGVASAEVCQVSQRPTVVAQNTTSGVDSQVVWYRPYLVLNGVPYAVESWVYNVVGEPGSAYPAFTSSFFVRAARAPSTEGAQADGSLSG